MATTIEQINQRIAVANAESKRLHDERQANLGKKTTLEQQLSASLDAYNKKYGTQITVDTIEQEVSRVTSAKEQELVKVESMLSLIKAGNYAEAEKQISGVAQTTEVPVTQPAAQTTTPVVETVATPPVVEASVAQPTSPVVNTPNVQPEVAAPVAQPIAPVTPVAPIMPSEPIAPPTAPIQPVAQPVAPVAQPVTPVAQPKQNLTGIDALADFTQPESPVAPPPSAPTPTPAPTSQVKSGITDFSSIISGTAFAK